ncbi:MAG: VWA domain-containing protein, partial [Planctomycetota bacterium]|nr:VWA domain-containing protein [Planctomycetota bacterium]
MSQRNWLTSVTVRLSAALLILAGASASFATDPEPSSEAARLATYKNGSETSFALSLRPKVKPDLSTANDLLILFDTSASQSGLYRKDALTALNRFLAQLNPKDQVKLVAVDVNSTDLHREFVAPQNAQIAAGLKKLGQRVPLGSTDMLIAMKKALDSFTNLQSNSPRHVIYIGDGM